VLPALSKAKGKANTTSCLNNLKQLTLAWTMYAGDNSEKLVNNYTRGNSECGSEAWVRSGSLPGVGTWTGQAQLDPNDYAVRYGTLFPYNDSTDIYRCPSDKSTVAGSGDPRSRSYSMSTGMNWKNEGSPGGATVSKTTAITRPGPTQAAVFLDEKEDSIDNNALGIYGMTSTQVGYWNVPASRHSDGCVLSFADGHAEYWKWQDEWILKARKFTGTRADDEDFQRHDESHEVFRFPHLNHCCFAAPAPKDSLGRPVPPRYGRVCPERDGTRRPGVYQPVVHLSRGSVRSFGSHQQPSGQPRRGHQPRHRECAVYRLQLYRSRH
jgi:prepilin-type processing-associated H-X9-DG protein